jgi:hypothetical protein
MSSSSGTVVEFSPDGSVKLVPCALHKCGTLAGRKSEHKTLNGLPGIKLGVFFSMDGRPNPKAVALANALRRPFEISHACSDATGTAYFYDDHGPMTKEHWDLIRKFSADKKARGDLQNRSLQQLDSELQCQMLRAMSKGDFDGELVRLQAQRRQLLEQYGISFVTFHENKEDE